MLVLVQRMRLPCGDEEEGAVPWEEMEGEERADRVDYRYKLVSGAVCGGDLFLLLCLCCKNSLCKPKGERAHT